MHVVALVESTDHVCCRYRLAAFRPHVEAAGHRLELRIRPRTAWEWLRVAQTLRRADVVILQRKLLSEWKLRLLRLSSRLLVFDFDDAVFFNNSFTEKWLDIGWRRRRFEATVRLADLVLAGNPFLASWAARSATERVEVVPTCVDSSRYESALHARSDDSVELVWIGSASTLPSLAQAKPLLESLGQIRPGLRLKVVCDRFLHFERLPVVACQWSEATEAGALAGADIGISWLPDDQWSRGKCGLKVLQYMAAGLPVVANPVGVQADYVRHGENGFLAKTPEQWRAAVGRLVRDPALRREMGRAGRRRVEADYCVDAWAARWRGLLEALAARGGGGNVSDPHAIGRRDHYSAEPLRPFSA